MLSQIQRFGGAMFTPVLLFPFAGIVVGLAILLQNPMFVGESLTDPNSLFAQIVHIIEEGGWTVFRNMPLIFAVGLPIGLAKQADAPRDKCTLSCAINGIHAAFHYLKKNYISGCVMTVPTGW